TPMSTLLPYTTLFRSYTIMSIGDGLVSQIPALVISIAAGFLVSKAGVEGSADKALVTQLATNPISLGMVSAAAGVLSVIPGMTRSEEHTSELQSRENL